MNLRGMGMLRFILAMTAVLAHLGSIFGLNCTRKEYCKCFFTHNIFLSVFKTNFELMND